jgi:hypothetical protein
MKKKILPAFIRRLLSGRSGMVRRPGCWLAAVMLGWLGSAAGQAQTNDATEFQSFRPGAIVRVQSRQPLIVLGNALFQSQTPSNIVVLSKGERYVLPKSSVLLMPPRTVPAASSDGSADEAGSAVLAEAAGSHPDGMELLMLSVQQQVLGSYTNDTGYAEAAKYYQDTMKRYLGGQISLDDIVHQAEKTLQTVDQYGPERAKDPQYESQIRVLKDFVRRARNGETVESPGKVD